MDATGFIIAGAVLACALLCMLLFRATVKLVKILFWIGIVALSLWCGKVLSSDWPRHRERLAAHYDRAKNSELHSKAWQWCESALEKIKGCF